jgi:hypothetical protein
MSKCKFKLLLGDGRTETIEAKCVITVQGAYMFFEKFESPVSSKNKLVASYPIVTTIIEGVEREESKEDVQTTMQPDNKLFLALEELVKLKDEKESKGKTPEYLERQPLAWSKAREILDKYKRGELKLTRQFYIDTNDLPDIYSGDLNAKRMEAYTNVSQEYRIDKGVVRDIFCKGADFYKSLFEISQ